MYVTCDFSPRVCVCFSKPSNCVFIPTQIHTNKHDLGSLSIVIVMRVGVNFICQIKVIYKKLFDLFDAFDKNKEIEFFSALNFKILFFLNKKLILDIYF